MQLQEKDILDKIWPENKINIYGSITKSIADEEFNLQSIICIRDENKVSMVHSIVDIEGKITVLAQILAIREEINQNNLIVKKIELNKESLDINLENFNFVIFNIKNKFNLMPKSNFEAYKKKDILANKLNSVIYSRANKENNNKQN